MTIGEYLQCFGGAFCLHLYDAVCSAARNLLMHTAWQCDRRQIFTNRHGALSVTDLIYILMADVISNYDTNAILCTNYSTKFLNIFLTAQLLILTKHCKVRQRRAGKRVGKYYLKCVLVS